MSCCAPSSAKPRFKEHCSAHLNRAEATSLLMLVSEFNRVKKFMKLWVVQVHLLCRAFPALPCV